MAQGVPADWVAVAKRNRTLDSIGQMTRKALAVGKDRQTGRQGFRFHRRRSTMAKAMRLLSRFESGRLTELFNLYIKQLWKRNK